MTADLIRMTLAVGVPLCVHEIKSRKGPTDTDLNRCREFGRILGEKGDILQYRSSKKGETADMMARFIDAIAVLACLPGGVDFLGQHWEA